MEYSLLLTATLCLLAFGAVMVFSASSARSLLSSGGSGFYYLERTLIFGAIGLFAMRIASVRGVAAVRALTPMILLGSMFLLFAVLLPGVGTTVNGAQRWIGGGLVQFQPSELAKVALILYGAHLLSAEPKRVRTLAGLGPYLLMVGLSVLLIAKEPDLGTAIVVSFAVCCVLFLAGVKPRTLAPVGAVIALVAHRHGRDAALPGGPPYRLPPSRQRHDRRRVPGEAGHPRGGLRRAHRSRSRTRACRRPPICPRRTPT